MYRNREISSTDDQISWLGFEFKRTTSPTVTPSMRAALHDLHLDEIVVVHAGSRSYSLDRRIRAISLDRVLEDVQPLR